MVSPVKVKKLDKNGNVIDHPYKYFPCIDIKYTFDKPVKKSDGLLHVSGLKSCKALIDTGADYNLIRKDRIPKSLKSIEKISNYGVNGVTSENNYEVCFHIPEADSFSQTGIISWSPIQNTPYEIILGRKFLQQCSFHFDRHNGISEIIWNHNKNAI